MVPDTTGLLYKPLRYLLRFCRSFGVNSWFPQFGGTGARVEVGLRSVSDFVQIALQSAWTSVMVLPPYLMSFLITPIFGEGVPLGGRPFCRQVGSW